MKRWLLLSFGFLAPLLGMGETSAIKDSLPPCPPIEWRLGSKPMVGVRGALSVNSSGLTSAFYQPFVRGGAISNELERRTIRGMEKVNRFGGDRSLSIGASFRPDSLLGTVNKERYVFFRLIDGQHYHARFTRDLFRTIFIGNAGVDRQLELAPFRMNSMHYRQLKFGILDQRGKVELGIGLSLLQGRSDIRLRASKAKLQTSGDGSELSFRLKGNWMEQGRDSMRSPFAFRGSGAAIDIMGGYDLGTYGKVRISIRDLGMLNWGPNGQTRRVDTSATFSGFDIGDPLGGNVSSNDPTDSLGTRYFPKTEKGSYRSFFPARLRLAYSKRFPSGVWLRSSLTHRPFTSFVPYFGIEIMKAWEDISAGVSMGYGGFGEFAYGFQAAFRPGKHWELYLRVPHLEGAILPERSGGLAASLGLNYSY